MKAVAAHRPMPSASSRRARLARRAAGITILAMSAALAAGASADAGSQTYSLAEQHLFMIDHLKALPARSSVLHYRFSKTGSYEPAFEDRVVEQVGAPDPAKDNGREVTMEFLTGSHHLDLPSIEAAHGNPVIMGFLERDVREMRRITNGGGDQGSYYKKRLRMAMVATRESHPVTVRWGGHDIQAEEFTLDPYKDDPARARYTRFANKTYTFVLSDQLPGGVYSMKSVMRDPIADTKVMIEESLTLSENP